MPIKAVHKAELANPFDHADMSMLEDLQRQASVVLGLIERCRRCNVPVDMAEADCQAACAFLDALNKEFKGPQSPVP